MRHNRHWFGRINEKRHWTYKIYLSLLVLIICNVLIIQQNILSIKASLYTPDVFTFKLFYIKALFYF